MIFTNLAPNTQSDDAGLALRLFFSPQRWTAGTAATQLESAIAQMTNSSHAISFESGRTALFSILVAANIKAGDEVLIQSYTCVAVPDPVLWAGAKPIYVDCDETLTMSSKDLKKKITPRAKAIIIQHTFGVPANLNALLEIARAHNLFVIEDCAHALGAVYAGKPVGSFGDAAFFSFGRDKAISSVFGGMATTNNEQFGQQLRNIQETYPLPRSHWICQQLLHPMLMWFGKATYDYGGKLVIAAAKKLGLTSRAVYPEEREGGQPDFIGRRLANALALLALHQLAKIDHFNGRRAKLAMMYKERLESLPISHQRAPTISTPIWLRYTIWSEHSNAIKAAATKQNLRLGDWYDTPIAPRGVNYEKIGYVMSSCPSAELIASQTINLPTDIHITETDVKKITDCINAAINR